MILLPLLAELKIRHQPVINFNELIEFSSTIALQFLNKKYQSDRIRFLNLGYSFMDIAIDAITPLFTITHTNGEIGIVKSLNDWKTLIDTESAAHYFLNKLVVNRVEQELIRIYKDADPFFAKIHDSLDYLIEKKGYHKNNRFGTVYITKTEIDSLDKRFITTEEFTNLPTNLITGKFEAVIDKLFNYLKNETEFLSAIPFNALIKTLKHVSLNDYSPESSISTNIDERIDIEKMLDECLMITYDKLDNTYKNKMNEEDASIFRIILAEAANDFKNGGLSASLYNYFQHHKNDITKKDFYDKYHSILDYLVRLLKTEIKNKLGKN